MTGEKPLRLGILGLNDCSSRLLAAYRTMPDVRVTALADTDRARLEKMTDEHDGLRLFTDWRALIDSGMIDALEIHLPPERHREAVEAAATKGLHLAVHKPLALKATDAEVMIEAVRRAGVRALVLDRLLFHPFVTQALELSASGELGDLQALRIKSHAGGSGGVFAAVSSDLDGSDGVDMLLTPAFDKAALAERFLGPIDEVFAYGGPQVRVVSFKFREKGRWGVHEAVHSPELYVNSKATPQDDSVELTGSDGILWLRNLSGAMVEAPRFMVKRKDKVSIRDDRTVYDFEHLFVALRRHAVDVFRGRATAAHSLDEARRALFINLAAVRPLTEARPVRVE